MAGEITKLDTGEDYRQGAILTRYELTTLTHDVGVNELQTGDLENIPNDA